MVEKKKKPGNFQVQQQSKTMEHPSKLRAWEWTHPVHWESAPKCCSPSCALSQGMQHLSPVLVGEIQEMLKSRLCHSPFFSLALNFPVWRGFGGLRHPPRVDKQQLDTLETQDMRSEEWMCYTRQPEHTAGTKREQLSLTTPCREQTAAPGQGKKRKITISRAVA